MTRIIFTLGFSRSYSRAMMISFRRITLRSACTIQRIHHIMCYKPVSSFRKVTQYFYSTGVYVAGAQTPYTDYQFRVGEVLKFPADASLDFNSHYVKKQNVPIKGEVNVILHTLSIGAVQKMVKPFKSRQREF